MASSAPTSVSKRTRSATGAATAAERRVQPHAGPNPAAADSGANAANGMPPAALLYRRALESIFAFLRQGELAFALRVSHGWLSAVQSMASLQLTVVRPAAPMCVVATSAMGRHTAAMGEPSARVKLTADSLFILAHFTPHLRSLACRLSLRPAAGQLLFPAALRSLHIDLHKSAHITAADANAALRSISRMALLESLVIVFPWLDLDPLVSLAPLAAMPMLRRFDIRAQSDEIELTDAQVEGLRALPHLRQIDVPMTAPLLRRLIRQPPQLQWQQISFPEGLDDELAALLPQLPSLTALRGTCTCTRFDWLRALPSLTEFDLWFDGAAAAADGVQSLVAALQHCTAIEILALGSCATMHLTAAHLADLLPRLPRLRQLTLRSLHIDSLSFLAQPPMTGRLSKIDLDSCFRLPVAEVRHVPALRALRTLRLCRSFTGPLDSDSLSLCQPASPLMPLLEQFDYTEPFPY